MVPLPGAHSPLTVMHAGQRVIFGVRHRGLDRLPRRLFRAGDQQRVSAADNLRGDRRDLIRGLPEAEDDLGKTLPDRAVMVDLGKPKVLKGLLAQGGQNRCAAASTVGPAFAQILSSSASSPASLFSDMRIVHVLLTLKALDRIMIVWARGQKPPS